MDADPDELAAEIADSLAMSGIGGEYGSTLRLLVGAAFALIASIRRAPRAVFAFDRPVTFIVNNPVEHGARFSRALVLAVPTDSPPAVFADARHADAALGDIADIPGVGLRAIHALGSFSRLRRALRLRRFQVARDHLRDAPHRLAAEVAFLSQSLRYQAALDTDFSAVDVIVTDFDRGPSARPWVWAAKRSGKAVATAFHGSPSAETYLPVIANVVFAWGPAQSAWLEAHHVTAAIHVVGRPDIDSRASIDRAVARLVICHSREVLLPEEQRELVLMTRSFERFGAEIVLRRHPSVRGRLHESWRPIEERARLEPSAGQPLTSFLREGDFVVGVASTALVDALISGHGVAVIAAPTRPLPADLEAIARITPSFTDASGNARVELSQDYLEALQSLSTRLVAAVGAEAAEVTGAVIVELAERPAPPEAHNT